VWERIETEGRPELRDPILIVSLSTSLPQYKAMYSQAKELGEFLLRKIEFTKLATIYASALPPVAVISNEGIVRLSSAEFYSHPGPPDLVLLVGDSSPQDEQYEFADAVLRYAKDLGVDEVISIGTRWAEQVAPPTAVPKVTGFASDDAGVKVLRGLGVEVVEDEPAPFFASLVVGLAEKFGMTGYKLSVDHGEPVPHPLSVIRLLGVLEKMVGLHVGTDELEAKARDMAKEIQSDGSPETGRERGGVYG
jgi:proteasome assembly chaperone (PAC2) family protein